MLLCDETKNKLDYVANKLHILVSEFYLEHNPNNRFTKDIDMVEKLENELIIIDEIVSTGQGDNDHRQLLKKYIAIANEFRYMKQ